MCAEEPHEELRKKGEGALRERNDVRWTKLNVPPRSKYRIPYHFDTDVTAAKSPAFE